MKILRRWVRSGGMLRMLRAVPLTAAEIRAQLAKLD
jgi:hypothetical protein